METRRSSGIFAMLPAPAAVVLSSDGRTNLPLWFLMAANAILFWIA
jgi:hypothetical protein